MITCERCAGEVNRKGGFSHTPTECIDYLCGCREQSKKGREHDREQFRQGVDAWQKRIRKVEDLIRKTEEQVVLYVDQVGGLRGNLADAKKRANDNEGRVAAGLEELQRVRREAQLQKEAKWDAEKRLASVEKGAARMKAVVDTAIKWREARRDIPDAQLRGDESEDVAFHAYDDAIQKLQRAVSELE